MTNFWRSTGFGGGWRKSSTASRDISAPWRSRSGTSLRRDLNPSIDSGQSIGLGIQNASSVNSPSSSDSQEFNTPETDLLSSSPESEPDALIDAGTPSLTTPSSSPRSTSTSPAARTDSRRHYRIHSIRELAAGTVIHGLHVSEAVDPAASSADWRVPHHPVRVDSDTWRRITYKHRFFVVVQVMTSTYIALPIFTKSGRGLAHVSRAERQNFMSVRDHRTDNFQCQNPGLPILETEEMDPRSVLLAPMSVVNFTAPQSFQITHAIDIVGQLTGRSTAMLLQHYHRQAGQVLEEPTPEVIQTLSKTAQIARTRQQEFNAAVANDPNYGLQSNVGLRTPSRSPPRGTRAVNHRRTDSLDTLADVLLPGSHVASPPSEPVSTRPRSFNRFDILRLDDEDEVSDADAGDDQ